MIRSKRRTTSRFSSHTFLSVLVVLSGIVAYKLSVTAYEKYQINKQISNLDTKLQSVAEESDRLEALIDRLENKDEVEKEARRKLNLVKEGEKTVIITDVARAEAKEDPEVTVASSHWTVNPKKWFTTIFSD